ncbi:hypothetical protein [Pseudomonas alliivorans]|uniref:hypothetical protein n=1 Tax=Pseudomonas alliivorans TaxID=2810613 RepID=UPI00211C0B15|nr:hypothetical protein [Pseudomonas alliivorans]
MSFGMRIWGEGGQLQVDENSFTVRVVFTDVVTFTSQREIRAYSVPGCHPGNAAAIVIPLGTYDAWSARQFETQVNHDVVEVANYMRHWSSGRNTAQGSMRLIVMRFN